MHLDQALQRSLVAVPSINGSALLARLLPTLNIPPEIVVVLDQGSTDDTEKLCRSAGVQVVQLGQPHTYTQACNIAARLAGERGAEFLFILNNDIAFTTDVARELLQEMLDDPGLGIVAPSQVMVDERSGERLLTYRVFWDLSAARFEHDFQAPSDETRRLEADFCELTCALIRMSAIAEIGFLDDEYGFYHEDADFGFRLRRAGYASAYLPQSQIEHYAGSTFSAGLTERKLAYIAKNKQLFARKFLGYGVQRLGRGEMNASSWNIISQNLQPYLQRFGLLRPHRPELLFAYPGAKPFDYLYTAWDMNRIPEQWVPYNRSYKAVFTASRWDREVFEKAGYANVHDVPLGVETDVFHPWGASPRSFAETTYLWLSPSQDLNALATTLKAWTEFRGANPDAWLIAMGVGVLDGLGHSPTSSRRWKNLIVADYPDLGISLRETIRPLTDHELADVYRSVDFLVSPSRQGGLGFGIAQAMACGTLPIFPDHGATRELRFRGALLLQGNETSLNDSGARSAGNSWEPSANHLVSLLKEAQAIDSRTRRQFAAEATRLIRRRFTWRNTCIALHTALVTMQEQDLRVPAFPGMPGIPDITLLDWWPRNVARVHLARREFATVRRSQGTYRALRSIMHLVAGYTARRADWLGRQIGLFRGKPFTRLWLPLRKGVLFVGYVEAGLGLGESLRNLIKSTADTGIPFAIYPFNVNVETRFLGTFMKPRYDREGQYEVNVIEVSCDELPAALAELGEERTRRSYNILRTYWELPRAPLAWAPLLDDIDEIWSPTTFVSEAFRPIFNGPITVVPPCVENEVSKGFDRAYFGMNPERFYFLFSFDYFSFPSRKNPLGVLRAFRKAFEDPAERVGLVIKSTGAKDHHPDVKQEIAEAARHDDRILVIDRTMSRSEMLSLIRHSDCYVSLHRSEGFGLGMAEAMALGNAVIGTDYSGNTDFLSDRTGFPIPYELRSLHEGEYVWWEDQHWAEPDEAAAAETMRRVFRNDEEREIRAAAGKAFIETHFGRENVGRIAEQRLNRILSLARRVREY